MHYLMMPLGEHYDGGFGATAEAFFSAARMLHAKQESPIFFALLPQNFLLRHSIELFLKSEIVIIHRKLKIPFNDKPPNSSPMVLIGDEWMPFYRVHSIADLYHYWKHLIVPNSERLRNLCQFKPDWTIGPEVDDSIAFIEKTDPNSTYYRYPANRDPNEDKKKSPFKETAQRDIFPASLPENKKIRAFIVENENREFVRGYVLDEDTEKEATEALFRTADYLNNFHAMMRIELTGGW
jgi:hypothetical protein